MGITRNSTQSPAGYSAQNLAGAQLAARMAAASSSAVRGSLVASLQDGGFRYKIHPSETAAGLVDANLQFGFEYGDDRRYKAVGDGVTDDTTPLTNMINVANASTAGMVLTLRALTYGITAPLPRLTANGVQISGLGTDEVHSGPSLGSLAPNTTVIKWIGTANAGTMFSAGALNGSAQLMVGLKLRGLTFDCNAGTIQHGVLLQSMRSSEIDIFVKEAGTTGLEVGPVASMTFDPPDFQFNNIRYKGFQNAAAGISLVLNGTVTDNTSFNVFELIDIFHCNAVAVNSINSDNNFFGTVRLFHNGAGTAIYSWTFQGSNTVGVNARSEQIWKLSCSLPVHCLGTSLSTPAGAINSPIKIYNIDKSNGSPDPVQDIPGQIFWQNDSTPMYAAAWVTYTPTITGGGAGFVAGAAQGRYLQEPRKTTVIINVPVTTAGTGSTAINATLPPGIPSAVGAFEAIGAGYDSALGPALFGTIASGASVAAIMKITTGGYPASNGSNLFIEVTYETLL